MASLVALIARRHGPVTSSSLKFLSGFQIEPNTCKSSQINRRYSAQPNIKMANKRRTFVVGVGMTKFEKPGRGKHDDYPAMAHEATTNALKDAGISYDQIEQAAVGYCYGDSTCGQKALYSVGMTGIPIYNVNNNCSTGSTALFLAKQLVEGGIAECTLALGFEKMQPGSLSAHFNDRANPLEDFITVMAELRDFAPAPPAAQLFGNAGREHMEKYGTTVDHLAKIAWKNHKHSTKNPYSQFQDDYTLQEIKDSQVIHEPLTKLQCCPSSDGSAAVVVCSEDFVHKHSLYDTAVEILGMEMVTDKPGTFKDKSSIKLVGYDMTKRAAEQLFAKTGKTPEDVQVIELHDCFSANELITYEALGLCPEGKAGEFIDAGDNTYGGKYVVNPSGGLISKGHPLGATGLAQCTELSWQLRNQADQRQVPGAKLALQHNIGLGGAVVCALYEKAFPNSTSQRRAQLHTSSTSAEAFKCESFFSLIENSLKTDGAKLVKKVNAVFAFQVTDGPDGNQEKWVIDVKNGDGSVEKGSEKTADCTLTMKDTDLNDLMLGKLQPQAAFMSGKLKVKGNMGVAMKLQQIMPKAPPAQL